VVVVVVEVVVVVVVAAAVALLVVTSSISSSSSSSSRSSSSVNISIICSHSHIKLQQTLQQFKSNQVWTTTVFTSNGSWSRGTVSKMRCTFWSTVRVCGTLCADLPLSQLFTKNLIKGLPVNVHLILNNMGIRQFNAYWFTNVCNRFWISRR